MGVIVYETPDGKKQVSTLLKHDSGLGGWLLDASGGGLSVGGGVEELFIPDHRVYKVELTGDETGSGTGTF